MLRNEICLHKENGIVQLKINGTGIANVTDYKIVSPANGKTELTFTIIGDSFATNVEIGLIGSQQQGC